MSKEYRSPGEGEGSGTQLAARKNSRGPPRWAPTGALWLIGLFLHAACATQAPMGGQLTRESRWRHSPAKEARAAPRELEPVVVVFADSPQARGNTRVVAVTAAEYQRAVQGPAGQRHHYEILSGTESNFALHGRRMASTFFRMIFF